MWTQWHTFYYLQCFILIQKTYCFRHRTTGFWQRNIKFYWPNWDTFSWTNANPTSILRQWSSAGTHPNITILYNYPTSKEKINTSDRPANEKCGSSTKKIASSSISIQRFLLSDVCLFLIIYTWMSQMFLKYIITRTECTFGNLLPLYSFATARNRRVIRASSYNLLVICHQLYWFYSFLSFSFLLLWLCHITPHVYKYGPLHNGFLVCGPLL